MDAASVKCPYFLEHSIIMILKLVSLISATVTDDTNNKKNDTIAPISVNQVNTLQTDCESSAFIPFRETQKNKNEVQGPWAPIPWGMQGVQATPVVVCPSAKHSGLQSVWLSLRLIRGVPSEVLSSLADRLGAGVIGILRYLVFNYLNFVKYLILRNISLQCIVSRFILFSSFKPMRRSVDIYPTLIYSIPFYSYAFYSTLLDSIPFYSILF